ncbi:MAG: NAD(P)-dependent oxidoreductase, partial [Clostridia bacterium]|nr:NAD(P)-dependent oxidoreductase [Clostridia bacterium]
KSDGTPWRPLSHVKDITEAFIAVLKAPTKLIANEVFNVGTENNNFTVREKVKNMTYSK